MDVRGICGVRQLRASTSRQVREVRARASHSSPHVMSGLVAFWTCLHPPSFVFVCLPRTVLHTALLTLQQVPVEDEDALALLQLINMQRCRRYWVHSVWKLSKEHRYLKIMEKLHEYPDRFPTVYKMSQECFHVILSKVKHGLQKQHTHWRVPACPEERLLITLSGASIIRTSLNRTTAYPNSSSGRSTPPVPRVPRSRPPRCTIRALAATRSLVIVLLSASAEVPVASAEVLDFHNFLYGQVNHTLTPVMEFFGKGIRFSMNSSNMR
ncbi:hypothetical protein EVAR_18567_1 [Eumeta japonica]|uniref:Uncharacterized protein n=1 Tax=Eumeta variegata TaxID=151549 RepID=A0A4C1V2P0_EUMVA|nr:hypothetical protein EVAR_18567_1 [Eumeta japonica]